MNNRALQCLHLDSCSLGNEMALGQDVQILLTETSGSTGAEIRQSFASGPDVKGQGKRGGCGRRGHAEAKWAKEECLRQKPGGQNNGDQSPKEPPRQFHQRKINFTQGWEDGIAGVAVCHGVQECIKHQGQSGQPRQKGSREKHEFHGDET